jgi:phytanoyl-CoA hydroxylase
MSQSLKETYAKQGYVIVRGLLSAQEVKALREEVDRAVLGRVGPILFEEDSAAAGAAVPAAYRDGNKVFRRLNRVIDRGGVFQQVARGKLAEAARSVVDAPAVWACLNRHNMLMLKAPFNPAPVQWHQDAAVWDEGTYDHITAIVAVDDFRADNGALQVLPGSHTHGPIGLGWEQNVKRISEEWSEAIRTGAVTADLRAGDALLMHGLLLHGSPGNQTAQTRRSLTIAYYPGDLRKVSNREAVEVVEV